MEIRNEPSSKSLSQNSSSMPKSVKNLTQLFGIIFVGIGIYGILRQLIDTGSLSLGAPVICFCVGACSWGMSYALGSSIAQDQALCESQEESEESAAGENE